MLTVVFQDKADLLGTCLDLAASLCNLHEKYKDHPDSTSAILTMFGIQCLDAEATDAADIQGP